MGALSVPLVTHEIRKAWSHYSLFIIIIGLLAGHRENRRSIPIGGTYRFISISIVLAALEPTHLPI